MPDFCIAARSSRPSHVLPDIGSTIPVLAAATSSHTKKEHMRTHTGETPYEMRK